MLDELGDAAAVVELVRTLGLLALVLDGDADAFVQERLLAEALGEFVKAELRDLENLRIRLEGDFRATAAGLAGHLQFRAGDASLVFLLVSRPIPPDFE